jgi:acetyl-CoA carboxylase biotin carboxyl carrier protein
MSEQANRRASSEKKTDKDVAGSRRRRLDDLGRSQDASINMDELRELIALVRDNGLAEFELERKGFRVRLRRGDIEVSGGASTLKESSVSAPEAVQTREVTNSETPVRNSPVAIPAHPGAQAESAALEDQDLHIITSPIVGTFYRSSSPDAEPFIKIGSQVEPESVVCIIEAMKLMNEIQAETTGEVVKIYVENGQPVEYGQPLFGIRK